MDWKGILDIIGNIASIITVMGGVYGLCKWISTRKAHIQATKYEHSDQGLFILFFELIFYKMLSFLVNKIIVKFRMKKFVYNMELTIDKKSLKLRGFYASGNNFCAYKYPVIFLKTKKSLKLGGISSFDNFYNKEEKDE